MASVDVLFQVGGATNVLGEAEPAGRPPGGAPALEGDPDGAGSGLGRRRGPRRQSSASLCHVSGVLEA